MFFISFSVSFTPPTSFELSLLISESYVIPFTIPKVNKTIDNIIKRIFF